MLLSSKCVRRMEEENRRHFNITRELQGCCDFDQNLARENNRHEKAVAYLYEQYICAKNDEMEMFAYLKEEFDKRFVPVFMDYYSEREIVSEFSQKHFDFLIEIKALQLCGVCNGTRYYTPTWR